MQCFPLRATKMMTHCTLLTQSSESKVTVSPRCRGARKAAQPTIANLEVEQLHWIIGQHAEHQKRGALAMGVVTLEHTVLEGQYALAGLSTATAKSSETPNSLSSPSRLKSW
jgi:hypothetical protein